MSDQCTTCDKPCSFRKEPFNADYAALLARVARLGEALRQISLGSQNSMTTKEGLGKEARRALREVFTK